MGGAYVARATVDEVTDRYIKELECRGWKTGSRPSVRDIDQVYQVFSRTNQRDYFRLRIPSDLGQQVGLQRLRARPLQLQTPPPS